MMQTEDFDAASDRGDAGGRTHGYPPDRGNDPNAVSPGHPPTWPFSITITIEIKGESTCPPDVKVRKG